jgi:cell division protein FtsI (penicillin-binding protein 3)
VQWVAAKAIADAVKETGAVNGTVIVMDPKTGAIIAHATAPTFNPNQTKGVPLELMRNPSVQDVYEPGSTGKVMTIAAALEEGTITPTTVLRVPDSLYRAGKVFRDHDPHPVQHLTTTGILAVSSNTGLIKVGETLGSEKLHDYLTKFGIGEKTGSGLAGESAGILHPVSKWFGTTAPTVAFGQGYSLTAMQATSVFATIANGGVRVSPTVIAGILEALPYVAAVIPVVESFVVVTELSAKSTVTIVPLAIPTLVTALAEIESTVILFNGILYSLTGGSPSGLGNFSFTSLIALNHCEFCNS